MGIEIIAKDKGISSEIKIDGFFLDKKGIYEWLQLKNIFHGGEELLKYEDLTDWSRAGAETYGAAFAIQYELNKTSFKKTFWVKAITSIPPEERLADWNRRRNFLKENRIPVSNWYWSGKGIIIEDFYPNDYKKCLDICKLVVIAKRLDQLGFSALNFLRDIRCDVDGKPFYLDFGFDLGEFSYFPNDKSVKLLKESFPNRVQEIELCK